MNGIMPVPQGYHPQKDYCADIIAMSAALNPFHRQKEKEKHKAAGRLKQIAMLSRHCTKRRFGGENRGHSMDETSDWKEMYCSKSQQKCDSAGDSV
jgi:hypothetical protein